jgi:hypothetical protein
MCYVHYFLKLNMYLHIRSFLILRSSLFLDVTLRRLVVTDVSGQPINPIFKGQAFQHDCPNQAKPSQGKVLTEGGDLREAQVDVPLSVSHSCV